MKEIRKKILPEYFKYVYSGIKKFEIRKDEDDVRPGDILCLCEWDALNKCYTGCEAKYLVTYVLRHASEYGLEEEYCIIGWQ